MDLHRAVALDQRSLALFRIGIAFTILFDITHDYWPHAEALLGDAGLHPRQTFEQHFQDREEFSLHNASGDLWFQRALLALQAGAAVALGIGWRTHCACALSWLLHASVMVRNQELWHGGDNALALWLFYGMFLPLGAEFSVDARQWRKCRARRAQAAGMLPCIAFWSVLYTFYIVNGLAKSGNTWRLGGTLDAVSLSFRYSPLATSLGYTLSGVPWLCRAATLITVPLELAGPVVHGALAVLLPPRARRCMLPRVLRLGLTLGFIGLHIGFFFAFYLGNFVPAMVAAWLATVDGWVWDSLGVEAAGKHDNGGGDDDNDADGDDKSSDGSHRWRCDAVRRTRALVSCLVLLAATLGTIFDDHLSSQTTFAAIDQSNMAQQLRAAAQAHLGVNLGPALGLGGVLRRCTWLRHCLITSMPRSLFADSDGEFYGSGGGWLVAAGVRNDGTTGDFYPFRPRFADNALLPAAARADGPRPLRQGMRWPTLVASYWPSTRWQKFGEKVQNGNAVTQPRWRMARWLCRRFRSPSIPFARRLRAVQLLWLAAEQPQPGAWAPPSMTELLSVDCDDADGAHITEPDTARKRREECGGAGEVEGARVPGAGAGAADEKSPEMNADEREQRCPWLVAERAAREAHSALLADTPGATEYYERGRRMAPTLTAGARLRMRHNYYQLTGGDHVEYLTHNNATPPVLVRRLDSEKGATLHVHWSSVEGPIGTGLSPYDDATEGAALRQRLRNAVDDLQHNGDRVRMLRAYSALPEDGGMNRVELAVGDEGDVEALWAEPYFGRTPAGQHGITPLARVRWDKYGGAAHWVYMHDLQVLEGGAESKAVQMQTAYDETDATKLPCAGDPCASIQTAFWQIHSFHAHSLEPYCDRVTLIGAYSPATFDGIVTSAAVPFRGASAMYYPPLRWGHRIGVSIWLRPHVAEQVEWRVGKAVAMQTVLATDPVEDAARRTRALQLDLAADGAMVVQLGSIRLTSPPSSVHRGSWSHIVLNVGGQERAELFVNGTRLQLVLPTGTSKGIQSVSDGIPPLSGALASKAVEWAVGCLHVPATHTADADRKSSARVSSANTRHCEQSLHADVDGLQLYSRPWRIDELRAVTTRRKKVDGKLVSDVFYAPAGKGSMNADAREEL